MNFKKLGSTLSKKKMLVISMAPDGAQWAGDDFSMYELSGLPTFTIDTLLFTFGVNMEKKDTWYTKEEAFPMEYDLEMERHDDMPITIDDNSICWNGTQFAILHAADRCFVLPERYLLPIWSKQLQMFMRVMPATGEMKIIAKEGLFITAIFEPIKAEQEISGWLKKTSEEIW